VQVGIATALDLILTGRSVRPGPALRMGLVDELCPPDELMATARRRAIESIGAGGSRRRPVTKRLTDLAGWRKRALEGNPIGRRLLFDRAEKMMLQRTKGHYPAAPAAFRAIRTGVEQGRSAGYAAEAEEFAAVLASPEAKALISIFFATQGLKREAGVASDVAPRTVDSVGIVGGGLMGAGIGAVNLIKAGVATVLKEVDDPGVARAVAHIEHEVEERALRTGRQPSEIAAVEHLLVGTTEYDDFSAVNVVIEAVFEDLALKRSVLKEVEEATSGKAIFASNTSSIPIGDIAAEADRPENVIGMHYFSPVERMPLLEIIATEATSDETIATCVALGKRQGKTVIVVNDGPGFYTTRILAPYLGEIPYLLRDGATIEDIDAAMVAWGFPVGPITVGDEVGIDVGAKIAVIMESAFGERMRAPVEFAALVADGRKGRKNGRGFYRYEDGKRRGADESVYDVLGVTPSGTIGREEIQDRLVLQMINEAARCLEEGVLRSARDGDIGAIMGFGFPPFRGGPFFYTDQAGPEQIVERMDRLAAAHGARFDAAAILRRHAESGTGFRTEK
jgi:3-hydroxyacyl-CoA dehydrogenase/enoyl-CoA hydratase/3-hydroxybutyryl-CoA epimerase